MREAIEAANTNAKVDRCKAGSATERDVIRFDLGNRFVQGKKAKTIVLGSQLPAITDSSGLRINGQKAKITISGNEQVRVFEVRVGAELVLLNLTVADGRSSTNSGGGLLTEQGTVKVTNSTFSENSVSSDGGGIYNERGTATLRNTIVAYSPSGGNCAGAITDGGYNIDDATSCGFTEQQDSLPSTDPLLADQPAFNGGPTKTIALLKGSPAINAIPKGENGCTTEIKTDQRGVSRPQGSGWEMGAFEKKQ